MDRDDIQAGYVPMVDSSATAVPSRRKIKENKDYKDFNDKDVSEIYTCYRQLFGDSFDADKYAVTPTKLCSTGYGLFEDSVLDDHRDAFPVDVEGSGSSNEAVVVHGPSGMKNSGMKNSGTTSGGKRKSSGGSRRDKKKVHARELSFFVDRATSAAEEVAAKINNMMTSNELLELIASRSYWSQDVFSDVHRCTFSL